MTTADFVRRYEAALATQEWEEVSPLLHPNASVTISDGSVHKGKAAVQAAFERNFQAIVEENYRITNVHWLLDSDDTAVYMFDFHWSGKINRHDASGAGKGTSVLTIKAEVDARYLREWLSSNAALGYVEYNADTDQFSLTPEQAALFAHEGEVTCMQGFFQAMSRISTNICCFSDDLRGRLRA